MKRRGLGYLSYELTFETISDKTCQSGHMTMHGYTAGKICRVMRGP